MIRHVPVVLALAACGGTPDAANTPTHALPGTSPPPLDNDGDGFTTLSDCDDDDAQVYPGAPELCDGQLNDCSAVGWTPGSEQGVVSHQDGTTWTDVTAAFTGAYDLPTTGVVHVCPGTYDVSLVANQDAATVRGRGSAFVIILDANGQSPVASLSSSYTTLENLTLRNGSSPEEGGGVWVSGGEAILRNVVIFDNAAQQGGGLAVRDSGAALGENLWVLGNSVTGSSGGIHVNAGSSLVLEDSFVLSNTATSTGGIAGPGEMTIRRTLVSGNEGGTGGIQVHRGLLEDVEIADNVGTTWVGGLEASPPAGQTVHLVRVEITGNDGSNLGGADLGGEGTLIAEDLLVSGNASASNGGGLALRSWSSGTVEIEGATIEYNEAGGVGGGIAHFGDVTAPVLLQDVVVRSNTADGVGAGVFSAYGLLVASNLEVSSNHSTLTAPAFPGTTGLGGAGITLLYADLDLDDALIAANTFAAAATNTRGANLFAHASEALLAQSIVEDGVADYGGGLYVEAGSDVTLALSSVRDNTAIWGGGVYVASGEVSCKGKVRSRSSFLRNHASGSGGGGAARLAFTSAAVFDGSFCDMGTLASDNTTTSGGSTIPNDVRAGGSLYNFGNAVSFLCVGTTGC